MGIEIRMQIGGIRDAVMDERGEREGIWWLGGMAVKRITMVMMKMMTMQVGQVI
jgi:hypothetical protein